MTKKVPYMTPEAIEQDAAALLAEYADSFALPARWKLEKGGRGSGGSGDPMP